MALWSVETGKQVKVFPGERESNSGVLFSPDGKLLAAGDSEGEVKLWSTETGELYPWKKAGHGKGITNVTLTKDGKLLASSSRDGTLRLWSFETGAEIRTISAPEGKNFGVLALSPDGKVVAAAAAAGNSPSDVTLFSVTKGAELRTLDGLENSSVLAFRPDGRLLASAGADPDTEGSAIRLWNVETGEVLHTVHAHDQRVLSLAWNPDGETLASGSGGEGAEIFKLWPAGLGTPRLPFKGRGTDFSPGEILGPKAAGVWSAAFSPDGKTVASTLWRTIKLWSPATGEEIRSLEGHRHWITGVAFSPGGELVASADLDGRLLTRAAATGRPRHAWKFPGPLRVLGFLANARRLAAVTAGHTVLVLEVPETGFPARPEHVASRDTEPALHHGRLSATLIASGTTLVGGVRVYRDRNGQLLVPTVAGNYIHEVSESGERRVLAVGSPFERIVAVTRDRFSGELIIAETHAHRILSMSSGGKIRPIVEDEDLGFMEDIIQDIETGDFIVTDRLNRSVHRVSRGGRITTIATSPLMKALRAIVQDPRTLEFLVAVEGNLLEVRRDGSVRPLIRANRANPIGWSGDDLFQDLAAGDFFFSSYAGRAVYRLTPQGVVAVVSNVRAPEGIAQARDPRDLVIMILNLSRRLGRLVRFSRLASASDAEIGDWLGNASPELLAR